MQTYVVAIDQLDQINNFKHVPTSFVVDINNEPSRVIIHTNPATEIIESKLISNYDLLIKPSHWQDRTLQDSNVAFDSSKTIELPRFNKIQQATRLMKLSSKLRLKNFCPVPIWIARKECANWACNGAPDSNYIIKCNDGARGIGQVLVKDNIPLAHLLHAIYTDGMTAESLRTKFPGIVFNTDGENSENEGLTMIRNQGFHISEYIPNIVAEYRLTITHHDVVLPVKRGYRSDSEFKQATGVSDVRKPIGYTIAANADSVELMSYINEIRRVVSLLDTPFGSCDIFITRDGKWGMFEYCNQFGTDAYSSRVMTELHIDFIAKELKNRFSK